MKKIAFILTTLLLMACGNQPKKEKQEEKTTSEAIETTSEEEEEEEQEPILLGIQNREALQDAPYKEWFDENYAYIPDEVLINELSKSLSDVSFIVFMGTWCSDSQMQVPAFFKILDEINFDEKNIRLITMTRDKDTPQELEKGFDIEFVPTIIMYKNNEELGRIVESPVETLEKDLLAIANGEDYKHIYAE